MWRRGINRPGEARRGEAEARGGYDERSAPGRAGRRRVGATGAALAAVLAAGGLLTASAGDHMDFYQRQVSDPAWMVRAAEFHGHLGPWLVVGAMVGDDALKRLETRGHWLIEVTCALPPEKQKPPFTCILDGLQAATGATMGKCNLHVAWEPTRFGQAWPAVAVVRPAHDGRPAAGVLYKPLPALRAFLERMTPDRLEELSRELAGRRVGEFFDAVPWTPPESATKASH